MSFQDADYFNAINGNQFDRDLMPKHPALCRDAGRGLRRSVIGGAALPTGRAAIADAGK